MSKNLYIDASHPNETRIVLKSNKSIEEYEFEDKNNLNFKNNIYLGTISRVEPSLQAAFVNFGRDRHGFLAFNDIQSDYYQIPSSDLEKIKEEEKQVREELAKQSEKEEIDNEKNDNDAVEKKPEVENQNEGHFKQSKAPSKRYKIQEVIKPNQVILVQVLKDERGLKIAARGLKLIIPSELQFTAERILKSPARVGTADNDVNALVSMGMIPGGYTVNHYLTDTDAFYITTDVPNGMKHMERAPLTTKMEGDFDTGNVRYKARERYVFGVSDPRGIFGTSGA